MLRFAGEFHFGGDWTNWRKAAFLVAALALLFASAFCSGSSLASRLADNPPQGWTTHRDPLGFSLDLPSAWKVAADQATGRIDLTGTQGEQIVYKHAITTVGPARHHQGQHADEPAWSDDHAMPGDRSEGR